MQVIREIAHCFTQIYQTLGNRRRHERVAFEAKVNATWKNQYGQMVTHSCTALNVSPAGISVISEEPAMVSTDAYLHSSAHQLKAFAAVKYCKPGPNGYTIGFQFRPQPAVWDGF